MWSVWPIAIGLAIEFFFYWKIYEITPGKALIADIVANAISAGLGIVLIPLAGILWEFSVGRIVASAIHWGTFNPVTWVATVLLSATINAAVEGYSLKLIFKYPFNRRIFGWLSVANFFSVAVAFASLWVNPYQP
ncbi:MAG TPA: hypothetical protein VMU16_12770 [Candidatus Binataceae bacterium]|nr:hypothetical protein [Candidatus Binataceae bacterium]